MKSHTEYLTMNLPSTTGFINITPQIEEANRRLTLHAAVDRTPAGQHFGANLSDDDDRRNNDQSGNQGVLQNFTATLVAH